MFITNSKTYVNGTGRLLYLPMIDIIMLLPAEVTITRSKTFQMSKHIWYKTRFIKFVLLHKFHDQERNIHPCKSPAMLALLYWSRMRWLFEISSRPGYPGGSLCRTQPQGLVWNFKNGTLSTPLLTQPWATLFHPWQLWELSTLFKSQIH